MIPLVVSRGYNEPNHAKLYYIRLKLPRVC